MCACGGDLVQPFQCDSGNSKHPSCSAAIVHVGMEAEGPAAAGPTDIWVTAEEAILDERETSSSGLWQVSPLTQGKALSLEPRDKLATWAAQSRADSGGLESPQIVSQPLGLELAGLRAQRFSYFSLTQNSVTHTQGLKCMSLPPVTLETFLNFAFFLHLPPLCFEVHALGKLSRTELHPSS